MKPSLRSTFRRAAEVSDDELRELWRFRLQHVTLKPTVTPERDWESFSADFRWPGWVWILRDHGAVAGFFLQRGVPMTFEGRALLCLLPEYGFLAKHLRGHPVLPLGSLAITLACVARHPLRSKWVAASTYPPGYIAFRRVIAPFYTLRDPSLPAWEKRLLLHLAEKVSGASFDGDEGTVTMRTVPFVEREPSPDDASDSARLYRDYAAANPQWRLGRGLFFLFPLSARTLGRVLWHGVERTLRGGRRGRASRDG